MDLGVTYALADKSPGAVLTVGEVDFASLKAEVKLVEMGNDLLTAEVGPTLALQLQISDKSLVDDLAKADATEGDEDVAADDVATELAGDEASAVASIGEGYFGMTSAEIQAQVVSQMQPALSQTLDSFYASLQPGSADYSEFENDEATVDGATDGAAALDADSGGALDLISLACDAAFGGPEDPIGDVVCFH